MYLTLEQAEKLEGLVASIAENLPEWEFCSPQDDERHDSFVIQHPDGRYVCISARDSNRVGVTGGWPRHGDQVVGSYDLRVDPPVITVALERGPEKIAREIERRFLPIYTALWERAKAKVAEYQEHKCRLTATQARIGEALGEKEPRDRYWLSFTDGWGAVEVSSPDTITIELHSLPVDVALAIIAAMREQLGGV